METGEDELKIGHCDFCFDYSEELIQCPESFEEVKNNSWIQQKICKECCKESFDNRMCFASCGQKFIEDYNINKLRKFCESNNFERYGEYSYLNSQKSFMISPNKFEEKYEIDPIFVESPLIIDEYSIVPHKDDFYVYHKNSYETLKHILKEEFRETPRHIIQSERTTKEGKKSILKLEGDFISGIVPSANLEPFQIKELKKRFSKSVSNAGILLPFSIELNKISVSKKEKDVVRIATVQLNFGLTSFPFKVKDKINTISKIHKALEKAKEKNVDIICFPELCFLEEWLSEIQEKYSNIIIIAGSYYNDEYNNQCQVLFGTDILASPQLKIKPAASENTEYSQRMIPGDYINIYESKFGTFAVLICRDFPVFAQYLRDKVDIIFVPSYNKSLKSFYSSANDYVINCHSYVIISNSSEFGGTSVFGIEDEGIFDQLVEADYKEKGDDTYKLCRVRKDKEGIIIADLDLTHKTLSKPTPIDPQNVVKPVKIVDKPDL